MELAVPALRKSRLHEPNHLAIILVCWTAGIVTALIVTGIRLQAGEGVTARSSRCFKGGDPPPNFLFQYIHWSYHPGPERAMGDLIATKPTPIDMVGNWSGLGVYAFNSLDGG